MKIRKKTFGFDDLLIVPKRSSLASRSEVDLTTHLFHGVSLKSPVVSSNMDTITESEMAFAMNQLGGLGIIHRYLSLEERLGQLQKIQKLPLRALSVGITDEEIEVGKKLIDAGASILCIDVAHGHSTMMEKTLNELRSYAEKRQSVSSSSGLMAAAQELHRVHFIAGNVATPEAAYDLMNWGADAVKVGIGPGSMCTTRVVTGAGYGQLSAIADCSAAVRIPVIADGGIRNSGDATKALLAGASLVMVGKLLAGAQEVPAWARQNQIYRGMASAEAQAHHYGYTFTDRHPEGVSTKINSRGSVADILGPFLGGIRSGFSYVGARSLQEGWSLAEFVECAPGVVVESLPHGLMPEYGLELKKT